MALILQKNTCFQRTQLKCFALKRYSISNEDKLSLHITTTKSYYHLSDFKGYKTVSLCALKITALTKYYLMSTTQDFDVTFLKSLDDGRKVQATCNPKLLFLTIK